MSTHETVIQLKGLSKIFHTDDIETHALTNVYLDISKGDFIIITGPSGCGKSTLLSILGLLEPASSGHHVLNGREIQSLSSRNRAQIRNNDIGYIFQAFNLISDLTVEENVELPLTYRRGLSRRERNKLVSAALQQVGMSHRRRHYPHQLSGGQQQRVAVARALVGEPEIVLADEPTGNLDSKNGDAVMRLLVELNSRGSTVCIVTHDPRYLQLAGRTIRLFDGRIVDEDTFEALINHEESTLSSMLDFGPEGTVVEEDGR
jgi:putative ABC transport system ATP-binding protein